MQLEATCPICRGALPFRLDRRGGRYFRCGICLIAFFSSGRDAIDRLEKRGTFTFTIRPAETTTTKRDVAAEDLHR